MPTNIAIFVAIFGTASTQNKNTRGVAQLVRWLLPICTFCPLLLIIDLAIVWRQGANYAETLRGQLAPKIQPKTTRKHIENTSTLPFPLDLDARHCGFSETLRALLTDNGYPAERC